MRFACAALGRLTAGQLRLEGPAGTLAGSFSLQLVHWRDATLDLQLRELHVDWQPAALPQGRLVVGRVAAASARLATAASGAPPRLPESLRIGWPLEIEQLTLGRFEAGEHDQPDGQAATIAESLVGRLSSDGRQHRLHELRARVAGLAVAGEITLAAEPPFALAAEAAITGEVAARRLAFDLVADGRLDDFVVAGRARPLAAAESDAFAGELRARISPLAPQPIVEAVVKISGIDPAAWVAGAPQAQLDLLADLPPRQAAGSDLSGRLAVVNRRPGGVDRQRLPVETLSAAVRLGAGQWRLDDLEVGLSGGGRLRGSAEWRAEQLALRVAVSALDAAALHGALRRTQLAGPLRGTLGLNRQQLEVDLRDPRFTLRGKVALDPATVAVETLELAAGDARLDISAELARVETGRFTLRGRLKDFDPSRFARLPAARLNADFDAHGQSQPPLALALRWQLHDSRLGQESLAGRGEIDLAGRRLRKVDVEMTAAGNQLSATGAFGAPGDLLNVSIAAPRLDPLGITGDLGGRLVLGGSAALPELSAELHSTRLSLAKLGQIRGLDLEARLADGSHGSLSGKLRIAAVDGAGGAALLRDVALDADGVRSRHRLRGQFGLPGQRDLRCLLEGGWSSPPAALAWMGQLSELTLSSVTDRQRPFLQLAAATPLRAAAGSFSVGPAQFTGVNWSLQLDRLAYADERWRSAGSLRGLPVAATLNEFPEIFGTPVAQANGDPLRLDGDWEIGGDGRAERSTGALPAGRSAWPAGRLRLSRAGGDLVIGAWPLGLEEGSLSLQTNAGRVEGRLRLRGKRLGELDADLSAGASRSAPIDRLAPWRGRLKLNAPDLAWAGPLVGDGWQLGGRLAGDIALDGTPAQPRLSGEWRGEQLAVRLLDQGMRLERGKLLLRLGSEASGDLRLVLEQLVFDSELQAMPRVLLLDPALDAARLSGRPGRLEASGELRTGQAAGVLSLKADRVGVAQRADQWMLVSGEAQLKLGEQTLDVSGKVRLDAAYWELAKAGTPRLSEDVVIKRQGREANRPSVPARLLSVNLNADLGRHFHFRGAGVESRLVGAIDLRSQGSGPPRAIGTIRTRDGRFDAYGQQLDIERGIVNFQGLIDNPGLNIRAMRRNLPVEAGVEVGGTAKRPVIRLVSDPEVPDAEKLSWLVLGQGPEQQGGKDASVLMAAAETILGGQDGGPLKAIQRSLGIDEFGLRTGTLDGSGRWQTSRVASTSGFASKDSTTDQIVSVGKRLSSNVVLSYDQSLSATGSVVKLTVDLSRNLSLVGRAGTDNGFDLLWTYRFGRQGAK